MTKQLEITIPDNRPLSINVAERMHWRKLRDHKGDVYLKVRIALPDDVMDSPSPYFDKPVSIELRSYQTGNIQDKDNPYIKPYIDALTTYGVIEDDREPFVMRVWRHVERSRDKSERIVIQVTEIEDE